MASSSPSPQQSQPYTIRPALESDIPEILTMIHELALYERASHEVQATHASLLSTLSFPSNPTSGYAKALLVCPADDIRRVAGMALYFHNYSTWRGAPGVYLEDLYVREGFRGRGFGRGLLRELARECVGIGGGRVEWSVLKWNEKSIRFYEGEGVGARRMEEWVGMRVDGEALERLADGRE